MKPSTKAIIETLQKRYPALECCMGEIEQAVKALLDCFQSDHKLLACGNGGSAADCEHIVGELMKAFLLERHREYFLI